MTRILPDITTVKQHQDQISQDPEVYRPERCPHCGRTGLHCHGSYERNAPRGEGLAFVMGPLCIPRFYCPGCGVTCSSLPACISPRRHYSWKSQQAALALLLAGLSIFKISRQLLPSRHTISRWWRRLQAQYGEHGFHLRNRFPELGRHDSLADFWSACLAQMSLANAMALLGRDGVIVP